MAFVSTQLYEKVVSKDPIVGEIANKASKVSPTSNVTWNWDKIHTSVEYGKVQKWFFETQLAEAWNKAFKSSSEAEKLLDAIEATVLHYLKYKIK